MKRLIRKILKEELEVVDKKFCDKVVNRLLSNVYLKEVEDDRRPYTFGTVGELYDIYALEEEIDEVVNMMKSLMNWGGLVNTIKKIHTMKDTTIEWIVLMNTILGRNFHWR